MNKCYIGIDNGVSGSIGYILPNGKCNFRKTPIKMTFSHTKDGQKMNRIDTEKLNKMLWSIVRKTTLLKTNTIMCYIERPFTDPRKWKASVSGARAMEATLIILEQLNIPHESIGSRKWQKEMLPGVKGSLNLKAASLETGKRLFPLVGKIEHSDYDGLLIAEWARRNKL